MKKVDKTSIRNMGRINPLVFLIYNRKAGYFQLTNISRNTWLDFRNSIPTTSLLTWWRWPDLIKADKFVTLSTPSE